ncbi:MAG: YbbR-like domain-containing protein [Anaerolineales bacterium]
MNSEIRQNLSLLSLSVLLAVFFWAIAIESEDPTIQRAYSSNIPVTHRNLPDDKIAYGEEVRVQVTIRTPQSVWESLRQEDVEAYVDLSDVATGTVSFPIQVEVDHSPLEVVSVSPQEIQLTIEQILEKDVPVVVIQEGEPALGYEAQDSMSAPEFIHVRGPASFVQQAVRAEVAVDIEGQLSDVTEDIRPVIVDENGDPVPQLEIAPRTVTVNIPIQEPGYFRKLPVNINLRGELAPGYRLSNLEVKPEIVTIFGNTYAVQNAPRYLQTQPISLPQITESLTTTLDLQMPEGLFVVDPNSTQVTVTIMIEPIQSSTTFEMIPRFEGLSRNMTATVEIDSIVVLLSGPLATIEALEREDVRLTIDVTNLTPGEYAIRPTVNVTHTVTVENVLPESIPIRIERLSESEEPEDMD